MAALFAGWGHAAIIEGTEPKEYPPDAGKHLVEIRREAANGVQEKMIAAAEAAIPDEEALRKAMGDGQPLAKDEVQWWHEEKLGIRIPFAITGDAVAYYKSLVEGYGKRSFKRYMQPSSKLEYHASAAFHAEFEHGGRKFKDVHVVTLKLRFAQSFAATTTEALEFEKRRTVILDTNGDVMAVDGDGPTEAPMLAI
ncbi:MAG: hypothetical protein ACO3JG_11060 [Luteolibacter sp.]